MNSILRHVAATLGYKSNEELEELYRKTAWHFEAKTKKKGSSYDWFKQVRFYTCSISFNGGAASDSTDSAINAPPPQSFSPIIKTGAIISESFG